MIRVTYRAEDGEEYVAEVMPGMTVMEAALSAGVPEILGLCGGICSCATCHIHIDPAFADKIDAMSEDENDLLDSSSHRDATSRLSCQVHFSDALDGLKVRIAEED